MAKQAALSKIFPKAKPITSVSAPLPQIPQAASATVLIPMSFPVRSQKASKNTKPGKMREN